MDESSFQKAVELHRAGRLAEAESLYREILARDPKDCDVCHLLGVIAKQTGRDEEATGLIERAIELDPGYGEAHFNLGNVLADRGLLDRAIASYEKAIQITPEFAEAHFNLGNVLYKVGRLDDAIGSFRAAIRLRPDYAKAFNGLGNALATKGQSGDAIAAYQRAIELMPDFAEAHNNLGIPLREMGRLDEAIGVYRRAIQLKPDFAEAYCHLGGVLADQRDLEGAIAACQRAIELKGDYPQAYFNLGNSLLEYGRYNEAVAAYQRAIELGPHYAEAHHNLGNVLAKIGQPDTAIEAFERAIKLRPDSARVHSSLGNALKDKGEIERALSCYQKAVELRPEDARLHSNLIYALYFDEKCGPAQLLAMQRQWARRHADPLKSYWKAHKNDRNPDRRIRIGYVSPDFRAHVVGRFILPLLAHHDHQRFEVFCYASVGLPDDFTARIRRHVDVWRDIVSLSNEQAAQLVEKDQIDILIDLTMHAAGDRLLLFARKPAPIQVTYLAYPGTTALDAMDYRITDPYLDPPGATLEYYTEKSVRLPRTYWCYQPPFDDLEPGPLPARGAGFITFGCLNNFCKVTEAVLATWSKLLLAVPGSRLILHAPAGTHRERVLQTVAKAGVDAGRIAFVPRLPLRQYMNHYHNIDIALDPFPYVGGTTTCDALWMGVPVVTLAGPNAIARGGASILSNACLAEFIARTPEEYIGIAANLSADRDHLGHLRSTLQQQLKTSPLMDAKRFALDVEDALRQMWRTWCLQPR